MRKMDSCISGNVFGVLDRGGNEHRTASPDSVPSLRAPSLDRGPGKSAVDGHPRVSCSNVQEAVGREMGMRAGGFMFAFIIKCAIKMQGIG